ncbi:hypothetical protein B0H11DRAFT_1937446, partial [Mycena galericulata]
MPQPSPVRAIRTAMRANPPTRFDLSPSNLVASTSRLPETPSRRRARDDEDENLDPALWTPSKKMRTLYAHLGNTSAGSLLLRSPKLTTSDNANPLTRHPAPPELDCEAQLVALDAGLEAENEELRKQLALAHQNVTVRDHIIEEANATMVFQNMGLKKMNEALHEQEEKATTDRARLFKGKAQCLSSDEFYREVQALEEGRRAKVAGREANKVARQRRKELREEVEKEWAEMKRQHAKKVETWTKECEALTEGGARKKDLPPKPKLGKKPQVPAAEDVDDDEEEEVEDEPMDDGNFQILFGIIAIVMDETSKLSSTAAFKAVSHSSTQKRKGKAGADKGSSSGSKRMRDAHSDNDTEVPASVVAAFAAISSSPSPKKKSKTAAVLHTENIKTVKTWSSTPGPGNFLLSKWAEHCPEIDINSLWACVNFVQRLHYINPSRRTALGVQAISQVYREEKRWTLSVHRKTAVCISVGMAIKSALLEPSTVHYSSRQVAMGRNSLPASYMPKILNGLWLSSAWHFTSIPWMRKFLAMLSLSELDHFRRNSQFLFGLKFSQGVPSSATRTSTTRTYASDDALHWEDEIPIYDGRNVVWISPTTSTTWKISSQ